MSPVDIITNMYANDAFSKWLGIEIIEAEPGYCTLQMMIRSDMCNGFGIAHGGITYSFADSALAFASNSRGRHALSVETSISHLKPLLPGSLLIAKTTEKSLTGKLAVYEVAITCESVPVALFKGTVYRRNIEW